MCKKIILLIILISEICFFSNIFTIKTNAYTDENGISFESFLHDDNMYYRIYSDHAELSYSNNKGGDIEIPANVEGLPVTAICAGAFEENYNLTSVKIPDTIKEIGQIAFKRCKIKSIEIPDSVEIISDGAFTGCTELSDVKMSVNIKYIGRGAFYGVPWLDEQGKKTPMFIINNILVDGKYCTGDIIIPDNINLIAESSLSVNNNITSITFPKDMEIIKDCACFCENLKKITLPENLKRIETMAFMGDKSLEEISIPESIEYIGKWAFHDCNLKSLEIKNPSCVIEDIFVKSVDDNFPDTVIYGYANSTAQEFAEKYDLEFRILSELSGDANIDGKVSISDAVMILQYIANPDKYKLEGQALINADCDGIEGVTGLDAAYIQKIDAGEKLSK